MSILIIKWVGIWTTHIIMTLAADQQYLKVAGSIPAEVGNILSWRLIMKYFLRSFSPFRWFKKGSCQFLAKDCTVLVNRLEDKACPINVRLGKLTALDMTPLGWLGHKTSTQTNNNIWRYSISLMLAILWLVMCSRDTWHWLCCRKRLSEENNEPWWP